jgi:uncharacterized membrane protein YeaQ/YmgE (transglycosylase-associated protein family)
MQNFDISMLELSGQARYWVELVLTWIGFGTVVGLAAKAIMPGRDPGGSIVTLLLGIVGTIIGCGVTMLATRGQTVSPISPVGFGVGTAGAFTLLLFYRLLSGRFLHNAPIDGAHRRPHYRDRKPSTTIINND